MLTEKAEVELWQTHPRKYWESGFPDSKYPPHLIGTVKLSDDGRECLALIPHETRRLAWDRMSMIKTFLDPDTTCPIYDVY